MQSSRLAQLLSGERAPQTDEEVGAMALVALNMAILRAQEDRERYAQVKRITEELRASRAAA